MYPSYLIGSEMLTIWCLLSFVTFAILLVLLGIFITFAKSFSLGIIVLITGVLLFVPIEMFAKELGYWGSSKEESTKNQGVSGVTRGALQGEEKVDEELYAMLGGAKSSQR